MAVAVSAALLVTRGKLVAKTALVIASIDLRTQAATEGHRGPPRATATDETPLVLPAPPPSKLARPRLLNNDSLRMVRSTVKALACN